MWGSNRLNPEDGLLVFVESGSSASGRRRSLRFEVYAHERTIIPQGDVGGCAPFNLFVETPWSLRISGFERAGD